MHLISDKERYFPNLKREDYRVTSEGDWIYNCIAHAAGKSNAWWWPVEKDTDGVFWPLGVDRNETLECFIRTFGTENYVPCPNADLEQGFEKIAIYVDSQGIPTHAARQLSSGTWTSKLGVWEDIEHKTLTNMEGGAYGQVATVLRRPLAGQSPGT